MRDKAVLWLCSVCVLLNPKEGLGVNVGASSAVSVCTPAELQRSCLASAGAADAMLSHTTLHLGLLATGDLRATLCIHGEAV